MTAFLNWRIKGEFLMSCNCDVFCPCVISLGKASPTYGRCLTWWGVNIHEGYAGPTDLSGLIVGLLLEVPGPLAEGGWSVGLYLDERGSPEADEAIVKIFSGQAGGPTGWFSLMVAEFLGTKKVPITFETRENGWYMGIPKIIDGEVEAVIGGDGKNPVIAANTGYWVNKDVTVGRGKRSRIRDWGRNWDLSGQSAEYAEIDWRGP